MKQSIVLQVACPTTAREYPIHIESGLIAKVGQFLYKKLKRTCKVLLLTDTTVSGLYEQAVIASLQKKGFEVKIVVVRDGEGAKTLAKAEAIYAQALSFGLSRKDLFLALGGGVIGDLTGFCAATYFRGVPFVQVPTTLLAQVDSSVGGKVAVNFKTAKNAIGAFYQPEMVLIDPDVLKTLLPRQIKAGLAEVVKYGLIETTCAETTGFFSFLQQHAGNLEAVFPEVIHRCCELKAAVVAQDETETKGVRNFLNLGHTFAHAYEEITQYEGYLHGEAVGIGLVKACQLSYQLDLLPKAELEKLMALLIQLGIPTEPGQAFQPEQLIELMRHDKKASAGQIQFVLPYQQIGQVQLREDVAEKSLVSLLTD